MTLTIATVMDGLAACVTTVANVYARPVENVTVPCVLVDYPKIDYDFVMNYGADRWDVPVLYVVGATSTKDALEDIAATSAVLRLAFNGSSTIGSVRVTEGEIIPVTVGAVTYLGIKMNCEVIG